MNFNNEMVVIRVSLVLNFTAIDHVTNARILTEFRNSRMYFNTTKATQETQFSGNSYHELLFVDPFLGLLEHRGK